VTTFEEWRVTGDPGEGYPPYAFTFSPKRGDEDPASAARGFMRLVVQHGRWPDGPHLHRRTVAMTDWEPA
jgi:hypothetical protein